jgi:hypothetical protein
LLCQGKFETYWKKVGGQNLSDVFKDLILSIFSYDGKKRPTIEQIKNHKWMQKPYSTKLVRQAILEKLQEQRSKKTADSSREDANSRGDNQLLEIVRQTSEKNLDLFKFNDMTDHDIDVVPGTIWDDLNEFNSEYFDG